MVDWFRKELPKGTHIIPIKNSFIDNQIAVTYLKYYIKHSDTGPDQPQKLILIDNYKSHEIIEFIRLINENHILLYPLIAHLIHYIQPLDVSVFHPYKHQHNIAIKNALIKLDIIYILISFLRDLSWIRRQTLIKYTIKKAFKKSGIYPLNYKKCLKNLKTFTPLKSIKEPSLPTALRTLKKPHHVADISYE